MDKDTTERVLREACATPAMSKLDVLARDLTGVGLLAVWSCGDAHGQIPVCGNERELPAFCRLLHAVPQGLRRCVTCHALLALAARNRGCVTEGRCHGGACVVAAPASGLGLRPEPEIVVISSCAFIQPDRERGWRITRQIARDLGIDLATLRRAYAELPDLHGAKLKTTESLVDAAAATLTEILRNRVAGDAAAEPPTGIEEQLRAALQASRDPAFRHSVGSAQATVVDVVRSVVGANPQLPVTVADIARAAHITPNHFSLIFRRQTGETFTDFLTGVRLSRAQERLLDLTLSIAQVARQAGFSDPNYFAKVFRKRTGTSPRQWRQARQRRRALSSSARCS